MEYLDGELLGTRLKRCKSLGLPATLNLGRQIASALAAAHQKEIVHRDLKPDNIMIIADPEAVGGERIKVFDFGLAKLRSTGPLQHFAAPGAFRTKSGMILGTPTHMSPEQCRGQSEVDGKADVYALGVILFEMLLGQAPFLATSVGDLITMHLRDEPPVLRKVDPTIPAPMSELVEDMLKKQAAERPTMLEVVQRLEALGARTAQPTALPSEPSDAAQLGAERSQLAFAQTLAHGISRIVARPGRPPLARLIVLVGAVVLVGACILAWSLSRRAPPPSAVASTVTFMIDSEPPGAAIHRLDTGELLGQTPWFRMDKPRDELLRLKLSLDGYYESTVIINQSQNSNQKVNLERAPKSEPTAPAVVAGTDGQPRRRMRWIVSSQPTGAEVILADDGQVLGKTPWTLDQESEEGVLKLFLQLPGYARTSVLLDLSAGSRQTIILSRNGAPTKSAKPPPGRANAPREPTPFSPVY